MFWRFALSTTMAMATVAAAAAMTTVTESLARFGPGWVGSVWLLHRFHHPIATTTQYLLSIFYCHEINAKMYLQKCEMYANAIYLSERKKCVLSILFSFKFQCYKLDSIRRQSFFYSESTGERRKKYMNKTKRNEMLQEGENVAVFCIWFCHFAHCLAFGPVGIIVSTRKSMIYSCNVRLALPLPPFCLRISSANSFRLLIFLLRRPPFFARFTAIYSLIPFADARLGSSSNLTHILANSVFIFSFNFFSFFSRRRVRGKNDMTYLILSALESVSLFHCENCWPILIAYAPHRRH